MGPADVERIARTLVREYGLPLQVNGVSPDQRGRCTVGFADSFSGATFGIDVWCDTNASPCQIRETLTRGLQVRDD